ncbi:MAG: hypothetical protein J6A73_04715 [Lachnospiraceae bacterium]|nr:hypothetical protein [Lachnospiraceae bacterium]
MNLLLALNTSQYGFFDSLLATGGLTAIIVIAVALLIYLLPAIIIANAIKKSSLNFSETSYDVVRATKKIVSKNSAPIFLPLVEEQTHYFNLGDNILVPKRYYNLKDNYYDTPVGAFVPVYNEDNETIIGFLYKK